VGTDFEKNVRLVIDSRAYGRKEFDRLPGVQPPVIRIKFGSRYGPTRHRGNERNRSILRADALKGGLEFLLHWIEKSTVIWKCDPKQPAENLFRFEFLPDRFQGLRAS